MKQSVISICFLLLGTVGRSQNLFPTLDSAALVSDKIRVGQLNKPYTVVIYGGVGCGYSKYLIESLGLLDECRRKADIILIMDQPVDSIAKYMRPVTELYPTFTNSILQYQLRKKKDIFPQLLLFKNKVQVEHFIGIKEGMLSKTKDLILKAD